MLYHCKFSFFKDNYSTFEIFLIEKHGLLLHDFWVVLTAKDKANKKVTVALCNPAKCQPYLKNLPDKQSLLQDMLLIQLFMPSDGF